MLLLHLLAIHMLVFPIFSSQIFATRNNPIAAKSGKKRYNVKNAQHTNTTQLCR